jgi:hypothetical protein
MNAVNPPKERQSREVLGLVKLKAKIMNIRELIMTKDQKGKRVQTRGKEMSYSYSLEIPEFPRQEQ